MDLLQALILGKIEGLTEFLPVSSTFHLLIAEQLMRIQQTEFVKLFTVFIQAGAILAVLLLYFKDLWQDKSLVLKAGVAFIPTAVIGLTLYDFIKEVLFESEVVSTLVFIAVGFGFIVLEKFIKKKRLQLTKVVDSISYKQALIIGCAQAVAVIPGVSRSGAVIVAMMLMRFTRPDAARFSFILSIPTILAAATLDLYEAKDTAFADPSNAGLLLTGFITAFVVALIIVKWFIHYLQKNSLELFGWYRIVVGTVLLALMFWQS